MANYSPTAGRTLIIVARSALPRVGLRRIAICLYLLFVVVSAIDFSLWFGVLPQRHHLPSVRAERTTAERVFARRVASSSPTRLVLDMESLDSACAPNRT